MKCHSKRLDSRGAAWRVGSRLVRSSEASLRMRFMVGDLVLKVGRDIVRCCRFDGWELVLALTESSLSDIKWI